MKLVKYLHSSPSTHKPLLFVHGAWHGAWCWEEFFMPYLHEAGFDIYALDLRGHGQNPANKLLNLVKVSDYVADVRKAVEQIGTDPVLVGHSMGGFIVQKYLQYYPTAATVLLAPMPLSGVWEASWGYFKQFPGSFFKSLFSLSMFKLINSPDKSQWAFFSANMPEDQVLKYFAKMQNESYRVYLQMFFPAIRFKFHQQSPMLLLAAEQDHIFSHRSLAKTAKKYGATFRLFPDMAHDMMLDLKWKEVAEAMVEWLSNAKLTD